MLICSHKISFEFLSLQSCDANGSALAFRPTASGRDHGSTAKEQGMKIEIAFHFLAHQSSTACPKNMIRFL